MPLALPPLTDTVALHPESHATDRTTVVGPVASTLICSDFVVFDTTVTET